MISDNFLWNDSLIKRNIQPIVGKAKQQVVDLYIQYFSCVTSQYPQVKPSGDIFEEKKRVDSLMSANFLVKEEIEKLQLLFDHVAQKNPSVLPLLVENSSHQWKRYALYLSAEYSPHMVPFFLEAGANPNEMEMVLRKAIQYCPENVQILLDAGAKPNESTLNTAVEHSSDFVPLFIEMGAEPTDLTLCLIARDAPQHIDHISNILRARNVSDFIIDGAVVVGMLQRERGAVIESVYE